MSDFRVLLEGLSFPEGPRWHQGCLWFSDFYRHQVVAVDLEGQRETILEVPGQPSGLGFDPDGNLLVVSMTDRRLLRHDLASRETVEVADLSQLAPSLCNDMVVDELGRAYIGNFGFERHRGEEPRTTNLVLVNERGEAQEVADDLFFPNGTVITPNDELVIAETWRGCLTAFTRAADGTLDHRRVWADLGGTVPDGICLDTDGAIWVADPRNNEVIRFREGGTVLDRLSTGDRGAFACMLGGSDRRTLFVCTCSGSGPEITSRRDGRIEICPVGTPGAGLP